MIRWMLLLLALWIPSPVGASHLWAGIDLCEVRKDIVPPGLPLDLLPAPDSEGSLLLQRYCTQCHNLPGPGRHTAAEWREVMDRMSLLMDVSHRFGALMGKVELLQEQENAVLLAYLSDNALKPWSGEQSAPETYQEACSGCHSLPDPEQHTQQEWPAVLARMAHNADIMGRQPFPAASMAAIRSFLGLPTDAAHSDQKPVEPGQAPYRGPWLALGPFLLLMVLGLVRWWRNTHKGNTPCATR